MHVNITTEIKVKLITMTIAALFIAALANPAEAKRHHHKHYQTKIVRIAAVTPYTHCDDRYPASCGVQQPVKSERGIRIASQDDSERIVGHPEGCPGRAFCGCGVSIKVFGHPVRDLYLASNWRKFPRAAPGSGMVAIWRHHVAYILSYDGNGNATLYDPNSGGHQTRIHQRDISNAVVVNPNGYSMAMR